MKQRSAKTAAPGGIGEKTCEDWCETNRLASEPVPVSSLAVEEQEGNFFEEACTIISQRILRSLPMKTKTAKPKRHSPNRQREIRAVY
jgi:hypothetical protein